MILTEIECQRSQAIETKNANLPERVQEFLQYLNNPSSIPRDKSMRNLASSWIINLEQVDKPVDQLDRLHRIYNICFPSRNLSIDYPKATGQFTHVVGNGENPIPIMIELMAAEHKGR